MLRKKAVFFTATSVNIRIRCLIRGVRTVRVRTNHGCYFLDKTMGVIVASIAKLGRGAEQYICRYDRAEYRYRYRYRYSTPAPSTLLSHCRCRGPTVGVGFSPLLCSEISAISCSLSRACFPSSSSDPPLLAAELYRAVPTRRSRSADRERGREEPPGRAAAYVWMYTQ